MKMTLVAFSALAIATICLECVRNKDYEDGVLGRMALWFLMGCAAARLTQIVGVWLEPWLGAEWASADLKLDNVETALWVGVLIFFCRHYYRFRQWRRSGKYAWRDSEKATA